ncbi:M10 family metallopeptidase C-terminal domain-containing protein [Roseomonas sp. OT10]|uniref:M10 family metallopeptidase n=1 Tax=Roseomonas cutis TaxID=2897332 RepID=UPI001E5181A8|nr:M10 family metallopeptidase [Roseomonas sp. OT10]UFN50721.1 M10 family metallopeptidase C-terminal domain-containing protein [Roseomonas sp. OT10]
MALTAVEAPSGNPFVDFLLQNGRHYVNAPNEDSSPNTDPFNINYFFDTRVTASAPQGYTWRPFEKQAFASAIQNWANVANITFTEVFTAQDALFRERLMDQATAGGTVSASHSLPSANPNAQSQGNYNFEAVNVRQWTPDQLEPGGNFYRTFMHEIGHGLGLKHPHDPGSAAYIANNYFPGVDPTQTSAERQRDLGFLELNHMFGSVMSYIHGYEFDENGHIQMVPTRQRPVADDYFLDHGFAATPMAYDIAAIQYMYGANMTFRTENNVYLLPDSNDPRPFVRGEENEAGVPEGIVYQPDAAYWESIWDAGGVDELRYDGARNAILDLTAATLDATVTSRGVLSYAAFIGGGYTIANGVVIENATGGSGNDLITGNTADNVLLGRDGNDTLKGAGGNDTIDGGAGTDTIVFSDLFAKHSASQFGAWLEVTDVNGGTSRITNVESLMFTGLTLDVASLVNDGDTFVDSFYYFARHPDVLEAGVSAVDHYYAFGANERRDPNAFFDSSYYLETYGDVAAEGMNPLQHYAIFGGQEGRNTSASFSTRAYLEANPDVAAAGMNALTHYLEFGRNEGRAAYAADTLIA